MSKSYKTMTWSRAFHILDINHRTFRPYFLINKSLKVESKQEVKNLNCNSLEKKKGGEIGKLAP